jgi:cellulose synthase/poly-beta-1,6-N-acetylglucosamine synthase-like glycosyltransferase
MREEKTNLVSVILPVYNRRHLIFRAIASVEKQSYTNWELLIIDDGSTDGLEEDLLPEVLKNPHWRYVKQSKRGAPLSRNFGIRAAAGKYVTFLDSDDEYARDHLQCKVRYFADHPGVDIIHGGVELIGEPDSFFVQDAFYPDKLIHLSECCIAPTFFGKREAFLQSGGFRNLSYSAESEFLPRVSRLFHVEKVDFPTYRYYTGLPDSICTLRKKNNNMG